MDRHLNKRDHVERRKHERFTAQGGFFAAPRAERVKLWQIIDISFGGLAFRYVPIGDGLRGASELDLLSRDTLYRLEKLPFQPVADSEIPDEPPLLNMKIRRIGVQFGDLTHYQRWELEYVIQNYTAYKEL